MAEVTALKGVVRSHRKQAWLDQTAQAFDKFVQDFGVEPEALFMVQVGDGKVKSTWDIQGAWQGVKGGMCGVIMIASEHLRQGAWVDSD